MVPKTIGVVATLGRDLVSYIRGKFSDLLAFVRPSSVVGNSKRTATLTAHSRSSQHPATIIMGRLGLLWVTILTTVISAVLSMFVAWIFGFVLEVPNYRVHILLALVIPFFVTPLFSYFTALSMRDLQRARSHSRNLAEEAELERTYLAFGREQHADRPRAVRQEQAPDRGQ